MTFRALAGAAALALLAACGSGDEDAPASGGGLTLLVTQAEEPAGAVCAHGGVVVSAGLDTDRDGTLDPEEVARTEPVCDDAPAAPAAVLTRTAAEPAGPNCAEGGTRVEAGRDANGDGVLGDAEVERTAWACAAPVPGAPPVLARVDPEPPGANCPGGGSAVRYGPDADGSGALEDPEVADTRWVCETRAIQGFIVRTRADADLVSAADVVRGWLDVRVVDAIDLDLHPTAVTGGVTVRSPGLTGLGLYCWTIGGGVVVEGNPALARFWMGSVEALGGDVVVRDNPVLDSLVIPSGKGSYDLYPFRYPGHLVVARNPSLVSMALFRPVEVGGSLVIEGNAALKYLFFDGLERVGGDLVLADNDAMEELPNLVGIPLLSVGGLLDVRDNAKLTRLTWYDLQSVGGLRLARNAALAWVDFRALAAVFGSVYVEDNPVLGFSSSPAGPLRLVTGWFTVERNALLHSLGEFGGVVEIGETLVVSGNPRLHDLAFDRLVRAGGVSVADNPALETIGPSPGDPFLNPPSLTRLEAVEQLSVTRNAALRQLVLPALRTAYSVSVQDNPLLPTCQVNAIPAQFRYASGNDDLATCP